MKKVNFPFSAILGQENMKLALILNIIDPKIGGVLLTGQQGTGKSTVVRSLVDILPEISIHKGCQFNCMLNNSENLCEFCINKVSLKEQEIITKKIDLVTLPLGSTEEMVIGALNIEKIIREGKKAIQPGLLAKANQGILYVDEINLLQDHLVDILLDVSASGINLIEREGISQSHAADFILVGSMNPEEGELRPQISDRLGLEVQIIAPQDPKIRAEITQRVIKFADNPKQFIEEFSDLQVQLQKKITQAKEITNIVEIPPEFYEIASNTVINLGLYSQRADITFIRCARAHAALRNSKIVEKEDLQRALQLVFEHRIKRFKDNVESEFLGNTFDEVWQKIPEAIEDTSKYQPSEENPNIFKYSPDVKEKFKEAPLNKINKDIPEVEDGHKPSKDRYSGFNDDDDYSVGYKVGDQENVRKKLVKDPRKYEFYKSAKPISIDIKPIMDYINFKRRISNYTGRGSRVRVMSRSSGRYIFSKTPRGMPKSIAFDSSIKSHFLNRMNDNVLQNIENPFQYDQYLERKLAVNLKLDDIKEKIFELHAPLSLYFIVDASASMKRTMDQIIKVIQSVHAEGYKKKDKVSVISFQGREARILQRPNVSFNVGLKKLRSLETTSYTPLASGLKKAITMIKQEQIKGMSIPIIIIISDLGANISEENPNLNAQTNEDFFTIENELEDISKNIGKNGIKLIVMKPKKSFATRYLGINPDSVDSIQKSFQMHSGARIFEADFYETESSIIQLKQVLE
jgi:Mg-chelatase subunit ChlI/Mg-chelatase subunit ChlD